MVIDGERERDCEEGEDVVMYESEDSMTVTCQASGAETGLLLWMELDEGSEHLSMCGAEESEQAAGGGST